MSKCTYGEGRGAPRVPGLCYDGPCAGHRPMLANLRNCRVVNSVTEATALGSRLAEAEGGYKITLHLREGFAEPRKEDNKMGEDCTAKEGPTKAGPVVGSFNLHTDN